MLNDKKGIQVELFKVTGIEQKRISDLVARETVAKIYINQKYFTSLNCSPGGFKYLATGFLYNSGIIDNRDKIISTEVKGNKIFFELKNNLLIKEKNINTYQNNQIILNKPNRQKKYSIDNCISINIDTIYSLIYQMQEKSVFFKESGAVHSCGIADTNGSIILFSEDIGRYNTVDRVIGKALLKDIKINDKIILTSCRITSGIMKKILKANIPIIISRAAVTDEAIKQAKKNGLTLIGFARGERMNIYTYAERIII